jgi:allantoinase
MASLDDGSEVRTRFWNLRIPGHDNQTHAAELVVEDGRVTDVLPAGMETASGNEEWHDLEDALVLPGVVDAGVRLAEGEGVATGTTSAVAGGVTCLLWLPDSTSQRTLEDRARATASEAQIDLLIAARAPGGSDWRDRIENLAAAGVAAIEVDAVGDSSSVTGSLPPPLRELLKVTAALELPVVARPQPYDLVGELERRAQGRGDDDLASWAATRPAALEATAISRLVGACRATGASVHVHAVSSSEGLDAVSAARFEGLPLSSATCPHYLEFTLDDLFDRGPGLATDPALRTAADRDRLWQGLASGELDAVASDHDPVDRTATAPTGSVWTTRPGLPGTELLLPYLFSYGVCAERLTLEQLVRITATGPARALGVQHRKGRLAPGLDADFVVFDEEARWTVRGANGHGRQTTTPLEGRELTGRVREVFLRGRSVYRRHPDGHEDFAPAGTGHVVSPRVA